MDHMFIEADKAHKRMIAESKWFLRLNELVWGWRIPTSSTDLTDLLYAVTKIPNVDKWLNVDYRSFDELLSLLRKSTEAQQTFLEQIK